MTKADGSVFSISSANLASFGSFGEFYGGYITARETVTGYLNGSQVAQQSFQFNNNPDAGAVLNFTDAGFGAVEKAGCATAVV